MTEPDPETWTETMTARERVRSVAELLDEPTSVEAIRKRADVSWSTADRELERLQAENVVDRVTVEGDDRYRVNPVRLLFDEIQRIIDDHDREHLEAELEGMLDEAESLQDEFDAASSAALRRRVSDEDAAADEVREIRNVVSTWRALEADIRLYRHALQLYDDVTRLQGDAAAAVS